MQAIKLFTLLLALTVLVTATPALAERAVPKTRRPKVEVVFVLDTTGSMGGLLQGAKQKVWSIVNEIAQGRPAPQIRLGLVGYRDKGDAYVTTVTDLTTDLDAVYEKLMAFNADGGGDGPEHVNQGLHDAVHKMSWSQDRSALKVIFLVGDAPPHMDYGDDVKYQKTCQQAVRKEIIVNTIQCGDWNETTAPFTDIAHRAEGRFMAIAQSGGTIAVATPYDKEIAELASELDRTHVGYGVATKRKAARAKMERAADLAEAAAPEALASRTAYRAGSGGLGGGDLLGAMDRGEVKLDKLADAELPDELKGKSAAERQAYVAKKKAQRAKIQKEIAKLSKIRDAYVEQELNKKGGAKDSFDAQVLDSLRAKAAEKGIKY